MVIKKDYFPLWEVHIKKKKLIIPGARCKASKSLIILKEPYKRTQITAHRQAKFYLPCQAVVPQQLVYPGAAVDEAPG